MYVIKNKSYTENELKRYIYIFKIFVLIYINSNVVQFILFNASCK